MLCFEDPKNLTTANQEKGSELWCMVSTTMDRTNIVCSIVSKLNGGKTSGNRTYSHSHVYVNLYALSSLGTQRSYSVMCSTGGWICIDSSAAVDANSRWLLVLIFTILATPPCLPTACGRRGHVPTFFFKSSLEQFIDIR